MYCTSRPARAFDSCSILELRAARCCANAAKESSWPRVESLKLDTSRTAMLLGGRNRGRTIRRRETKEEGQKEEEAWRNTSTYDKTKQNEVKRYEQTARRKITRKEEG